MDYSEARVRLQRLVPDNLINIIALARNIKAVVILGLLALAMFLISNTIRAAIYARKDRNRNHASVLGATSTTSSWPFFLENADLDSGSNRINYPSSWVWCQHTYGCIKAVQISSLDLALAYSIIIHSWFYVSTGIDLPSVFLSVRLIQFFQWESSWK